jgi:hypothetical protein
MSSNIFKACLAASIIGAFTLLISSCKKEDNVVAPPEDQRPLLTSQDFARLVIAMTDYDVVRVTHQLGKDLRSRNVVRIGVGSKDSTGYHQLRVDSTRYDAAAQAYIIHFDYSVTMDSSKSIAGLTVRYYLADSAFSDVDTSVALYKYPYASAEVFLDYPDHGGYKFLLQDIAQTDSLFFFHPLGPEGLFEYNPTTGRTRELVQYEAGDHIAAALPFVFYEDRNSGLWRYDVRTGTRSILLDRTLVSRIKGMDVFEGYLYVWLDQGSSVIKKYTFDGVLMDSLAFAPSSSYYMTIHNGIVYTVTYATRPWRIARFDLRARSFLPEVLAPSKEVDGIKAFRNQLYFTDFNKWHVGVMPIADLRTAN